MRGLTEADILQIWSENENTPIYSSCFATERAIIKAIVADAKQRGLPLHMRIVSRGLLDKFYKDLKSTFKTWLDEDGATLQVALIDRSQFEPSAKFSQFLDNHPRVKLYFLDDYFDITGVENTILRSFDVEGGGLKIRKIGRGHESLGYVQSAVLKDKIDRLWANILTAAGGPRESAYGTADQPVAI